MDTTEYTIYFAGELFDHKHLIGNSLLADHIERLSGGRYRCVLPQDLEQTDSRAVDIRNQDLLGVATCDCALFNFDGPDLDSGTVVEFVYAKLLDIPAVILRTDFRGGGDQDTDGDAWNLMASFYPRTRNVSLNAMAWYQQARRRSGRPYGGGNALRRPHRTAGDRRPRRRARRAVAAQRRARRYRASVSLGADIPRRRSSGARGGRRNPARCRPSHRIRQNITKPAISYPFQPHPVK